MGSAALFLLEQSQYEKNVAKFQFSLLLNRQQFARQISSSIFNDTNSNMLIIVDRVHSKRVHENLMQSLKEFEQKLSSLVFNHYELNNNQLPSSENFQLQNGEWTLGNSFNYALALLTTLGHGNRSPRTFAGQFFVLLYSLLGVPFFFLTLIVIAYRIFDCARSSYGMSQYRLTLLFGSIGLYVVWLVVFAIIINVNAIEQGWRSLYTAALSSLTIQTTDYNKMTEEQKLLTLLATTVSLLLGCITVLFLTGLYHRQRYSHEEIEGETAQKSPFGFHFGSGAGSFNKVAAEKNGSQTAPKLAPIVTMEQPVPPPRFQVIVDESGESALSKPKSRALSSVSPRMIDSA
ncbi:ion channel domain-containing protein [Ditylenchus destructor]|nr:ion channel domain-containing protein [Ditylenchus destructor]